MQIKHTLNVKITLNMNSRRYQNQVKCPALNYLYFGRIFRKWNYFCVNILIFLRP